LKLRRFDEDFVALVNGQSDGLLMDGAVMLNGRAEFTNAGMRLDMPYEL